MQIIPISLAEPEMVLEQPVMRPDKPDGLAVFGKGVRLTESGIERLRAMGVQSIAVEGHPVIIEGEERLEDVLENIDRRFRKVSDNAEMMRILAMFKVQIKQDFG